MVYLSGGLGVEEAVDVFVFAFAAIALADIIGVFDSPDERHGRYLPPEAIDQADRGREVELPRVYGPDLVLTIEDGEEGE